MKTKSLLCGLAMIAASFLGAADDRPAGQPAAANVGPARFSLKGKVALGNVYVFNVKSDTPSRKAEWLALGESIDGYTLSAYNRAGSLSGIRFDERRHFFSHNKTGNCF